MESWFWVRHFDIARSTSQPYSINLSERRMCCGKCCISLLIYFASVFSGRPYFSLTSCCGRINIVLVLVRNFILLWETETCNLNWLQLIGIFLLFFPVDERSWSLALIVIGILTVLLLLFRLYLSGFAAVITVLTGSPGWWVRFSVDLMPFLSSSQ